MQLYSVHTILTLGKDPEKLKDGLAGIFYNMRANQFEICNQEKDIIEFNEALGKITQVILSAFPATIYAKVGDTFIKIIIEKVHGKGDLISITPENPLLTKKESDDNEISLDLGFYVQLMIDLTENFAIDELYTKPI